MRRSNFYIVIFILIIICSTIYSQAMNGKCEGDCENGKGKFLFEESQNLYEGSFENGKFNGYGILKIYKGKIKNKNVYDIYEGMFINNEMDGEGIYSYANGDTIAGIFSRNKLNGIGSARNGFIEKDVGYYYVGNFKDNRFHGYGIYKYPDGTFYVGEFENGKMSGLGLIKKSDKLTFIDGYEKTGSPSKSIIYKLNQESYVVIENGKKNQYSIMNKPELKYGGEVENGDFSGIGFGINNKNKILYGEWINNKLNGFGIYIHPNGNVYIGNFKDNLLNGYGIKFDKDGDLIYTGDWEAGKRVNKK